MQHVIYNIKQSVSPKMFTNESLFAIQRLLYQGSTVYDMLVLETLKCKISNFLNSNTCFCSLLYWMYCIKLQKHKMQGRECKTLKVAFVVMFLCSLCFYTSKFHNFGHQDKTRICILQGQNMCIWFFNIGSASEVNMTTTCEMELFNFLWLIRDHYLPLAPT